MHAMPSSFARPGDPRSKPPSAAPAYRTFVSSHGFARRVGALALAAAVLLAGPYAAAFSPQADNIVNAVATQTDGRVLAVGTFTHVDGVARNHTVRLNADGSVDPSFPDLAAAYSNAVAIQPDGKILVGGAGEHGFGGLRRLNPDGSLDTGFVDAFTMGDPLQNLIRSIAVQADGRILIGGTFGSIGGTPRQRLARLNADGSLDPAFDPGAQVTGDVYAVAAEADGRVLVSGQNFFVRLLADGQPDTATPAPAMPANIVPGLAVQPDGKILVGAWNPIVVGGTTHGRLVRLNVDGTVDASFQPPPLNDIYSPIRLLGDGRIVVSQGTGGHVVRLLADGSLDPDFSAPSPGQPVSALALQADGKIVIGGGFTSILGLPRARLARLHADGRLDNGASGPLTVNATATNGSISPSGAQQVDEGRSLSFTIAPDPGHVLASVTGCNGSLIGSLYTTGPIWANCAVVATFIAEDDVFFDPVSNGSVTSVFVQSDGGIVVGGGFTRIGGQLRERLARLDPASGAADTSFVDFPEANGVGSITRQPDGKLLAASIYGGVRRIEPDGSVDTGFDVMFSSLATINVAVAQPDGKIIVGGTFNRVNDVPRNRIARLNADGSLDESFDPGNGFSGSSVVYTALIEPDGKILVGGSFNAFNGTPHVGMVRINPDGSLDPAFPAAGTAVYALQRDAAGRYLVGGAAAINLGDGSPADSRLVRVLPDGTRDAAFAANIPGVVRSLLIEPDGRILVGGEFTAVNGQERARLARLSSDGALEPSPNIAPNNRVVALARQADGKILIGGDFTHVGPYARRGIARLTADGRIDVSAFTVTPFAAANGSISPNVPAQVEPGATLSFTVVPDAGYVIGTVTGCGGTLDGLVYTTGPITAHCAVTADFLMETVSYTVTPLAGIHGALAPATPQSVLFAQTTQFSVVPDPGYYLESIEGCAGSLSGLVYTTGRILGDCTVTASFSRPENLEVVGGSDQLTAVGTRFAQPLRVRVTNGSGAPVAGVAVTFTAPAGGAGASLESSVVMTDGTGLASVRARANATGGAYSVGASAGALTRSFALRNEAIDHDGLELTVTVGTDPPPACGTSSSIQAVAGTPLNYCFRITNRSDVTLRYHTLTLATFGFPGQYDLTRSDRFLDAFDRPVARGESWQYHRMITAGAQDQMPRFTWTATATPAGYDVQDHSGIAFTDLSTTAAAVELPVYGHEDVAELPFPITYFGQTFGAGGIGRLCINNSGSLKLQRGAGDEICPTASTFVPAFMGDNAPLAQAIGQSLWSGATNFLLPYWDVLGEHGAVHHATLGAAPSRRLIVQWQDKDHASRPNPASGIAFQVVIEEHTGRIHYVYRSVDFGVAASPDLNAGGSATIGLFGHGSSERFPPYLEYGTNTPLLSAGQSISFTPTDVPRFASAQVQVYVGMPHITVTPASIAAQTAPGTQTTRVLTIGNEGDLDLEWSLREAPALAHFPRVPYVPSPDAATSPLPAAAGTHQGHAGTEWFDPGLFEAPAFGFAYESGHIYPVSFDAADPSQFVHVTPADSFGLIQAGDFVDDDFSRLYVLHDLATLSVVDVASAQFQPVAEIEPEHADAAPYPRWAGMAWDRTTGTLYASTTGGEFCSEDHASDLYAIDLARGTRTRVGAIDTGSPLCIADIAVSPDGAMYGVDTDGDTLVAIDKATGHAAPIGWLGFNLIGNGPHSLDFDDATGVLYLAAGQTSGQPYGGLFAVDPVTGRAALGGSYPIEPISTYGFFSMLGMAIATSGGDCVDPDQIPWLSMNQIAGVLTPGSQSPAEVRLDARDLEPGMYSAQLCLFSNDRARSLLRVPVSLQVTAAGEDRLFSDGFESR